MPIDTNRRDFMKATALTAGAWAGSQMMAASGAAAGNASAAAPDTPAPATPKSAATGQQPVPLAPPDKQPPDLKVPEPVKRKVGWAVVGLGDLALKEVMPAFREALS